MMHLRLRNRLLMAAPLLAVLACGGDDLLLPPGGSPTATDPGQLQMAAGDNQTGTAGSALPEPVLVQLVDSAGRGIADQPVNWVINTGGGTANPATPTTDAQGYASATW